MKYNYDSFYGNIYNMMFLQIIVDLDHGKPIFFLYTELFFSTKP